MRVRGPLLATAMLATVVGLPSSPAIANGCGDSARSLDCKISEPPEPAPNRTRDYRPGSSLPLQWSRTFIGNSVGAPPNCPSRDIDGEVVWGLSWLIIVENTDTGELIYIGSECQYPPADPPPDPPPVPPSPARFVEDQITVFELDTGISPPVQRRGVSQLDTWFWCEVDAPVPLDISLGGYRIVASVSVDDLQWTIEGPDGVVVRAAETCGTEPAIDSSGAGAAATWTPDLPGDYTIRLETQWSGTWTLTYVDPVLGVVDFGTHQVTFDPVESEPFAYEVYEIQTVGVPDP